MQRWFRGMRVVCAWHSFGRICLVWQRKEIELTNSMLKRELSNKDEALKSRKDEAIKWQAMHMAHANVNMSQYKQFQDMLRSPPDRGGPSSRTDE